MTIRESKVVSLVVNQCDRAGRFAMNNHGTVMSRSGVPDIVTVDAQGTFLGIEVKTLGQKPTVNQLRRAAEILRSGGRYVVAYPDFDLRAVDAQSLRTYAVASVEEIGVEFDLYETFTTGDRTIELVATVD